jgi:hypothetical protein
MAGLVDFILAQQGRKDAEKDRQRLEQTVLDALGRAPGTEAFAPGHGGMGLLADPTDKTRQAEFAGRLATVAPTQGSALMSGIFSNVQSGENQITQETGATARQRLSNEQSDINSQRAADTDLTIGRMQAQVSRLNALDQIDARLSQAGQGFGAGQGFDLGPVASGMARVMGPQGFPIDVALPGSAPHIQARETLNAQLSANENLDAFLTLFDQIGTERIGADSQTLAAYRQRIISSVAKLDDMGVLQQGELERIESALLDPTSHMTASTTLNSTIRAGYQALREQMQNKYDRSLENYRYWPGLEGFQPLPPPPGFIPESP